MHIDENVLLALSKTFLSTEENLTLEEISGLAARVLDQWNIRMMLFTLNGEDQAYLRFTSADRELVECNGFADEEEISIGLPSLPPLKKCVEKQKAIFTTGAEYWFGMDGDNLVPELLQGKSAIYTPLVDNEKPFGALVAFSPELSREHTLVVNLIAHELSVLFKHSNEVRELRETRDLLKHVASKYRNLIDRLDHAVMMISGDGKIQAANERLRESLDYTYKELIGKKLEELIPEEECEDVEGMLARTREGPLSFKLNLLTSTGRVIKTHATMTYTPDANTYQGIFRLEHEAEKKEIPATDNWLQKVIEGKTEDTEDYRLIMKNLLESLPGLHFLMARDGKLAFVSRYAEKVTGYTRDEFLDQPLSWLQRVHPDDRERVAIAYQKALLTGEGHDSLKFKFIHKYRDECHFISSAIPIMDQDGHLHGIHGIFQEVTRLTRQEDESEETPKRHISLFENLDDLIFVVDNNLKIQMINRSCKDILGYEVIDLVGQSVKKILDPEEIKSFRENLNRVQEDGRIEGWILKARHADGKEVYLEVNANVVLRDEKPVAVRGIARNVTERIELQKREKALQQQLIHTEKMAAIGELLGTVAHGMRNPLSSIRAVAQTTMDDLEPHSESRIALRNILLETDRLDLRIKEFLSFYKPFEPELKIHNINEVITESLNMVAEKMKRRDIDIDLQLDWNIPEILLDFAQIEQVLLNLYGNSLSAIGHKGTLTVITRLKEDENGEKVVVALEDTGPGIAPDVRERIFQPFFTTREHGTGMGLSVSRRIIEAHWGKMWAEEAPGGGARLIFWLPVMDIK